LEKLAYSTLEQALGLNTGLRGIPVIVTMIRQAWMHGMLSPEAELHSSDTSTYVILMLSYLLCIYLAQYYNRWANHEQSAKLSKELYAKTEKKMEEMQVTSELTWIEVQFARKAVDEVYRCRMTLKWTYAMAYYLEKGNEKELFEDNQR